MSDIFKSRKINDNTYLISGEGCDSYLLIADDEAVMIDGMSEENIREFAMTLTDLPVRKVINTHSHFDHTAGNGFFDIIYGTKGISRGAKNTMGNNPNDYKLDYKFTYVADKEIIDIKGRPLLIIVLDCHAPENIIILDKTNKMLFTGDEIEMGQVLLLPGYAEKMGQIHSKPASSVETYLNALKKVKAFENDFEILCPSHNGSPITKDYVDKYIDLAEMILNGFEGKKDCSSASYNKSISHFPNDDANYRRAEHKGATLIYCSDLIFDKDYAKASHLKPATNLHIISKDFAEIKKRRL